jgi:hypothetical protein
VTLSINSESASGTAETGSSAVPSWVGTLQTTSIATDMIAADVNGTVTYAGLEKLFADLDSTLASSNTSLTAAEFSDLKTIAANLNNGMQASSYLTSITNALVNGNAANATWTGGAASSSSLGNLAVGSSATQLSELNDKWFLGTDLPSSTVSMSGYPSFSVSYSADSAALFGANGPSMNDINQGYLGDCYFLSSIAEVAKQDPGVISSMFTSNGNGTYGVRFYVDGTAEYVTVNSSLADGGNIFNYASDIWASLAEKAYAQLQTGSAVTGNSISGNSWSAIGNGGAPEYALEEITGASAITDFDANGNSWVTVVYNSSLDETSFASGNSTASVLGTLVSDLSKGDDVVLSSYTNAADSSGDDTLIADHAMSIYGYDSSTGLLEIRNPWGTEPGQYWDTTFEVSLSTLLSDGDTITADNAGNGNSQTASPPTVTAQTATQTWKVGQAVNFTLASNTFTDPQDETLTYAATQANGAALPSWLSFNVTTQTFAGTPPAGTTNLSIEVTATDTSGLSASETFAANLVAPTAPTITNQTAKQNWTIGKAVNFTLASNTFTDPQGENLTYSAKLANGLALPSWLHFNGSTDTFTGTVPNSAAGLSIKVTATDAGGASTSETFSVLTPKPAAPMVTAQTATQTWRRGQAVNFTLASNTFTDPQGENLTYSAKLANGSALPSWLHFNGSTDTFTGTVPTSAAGLSIKVTATDAGGASTSETFSVLTPAAALQGPVAGLSDQNQIHLADVGFAANATLGYAANSGNIGCTLTPSDGIHTANIALPLLGQYIAASFAAAGDGLGGSMTTNPVMVAETQLAHPHA